MNPAQDSEILAEAVRQLAARASAADRPHPSPAELFAFAGGELDASANDEIREHLATCVACADRMLAFELPGEDRSRPALLAPTREGQRYLAAAAAALLLGAGLIAGLVWRPRDLTSPALLELHSVRATRSGSGPEPEALPLADGNEPLVLALVVDSDPREELVARLIDSDGDRVQLRDPIRVGPSGIAALALPAGLLAPGVYRVELRAEGASESKPLHVYIFEIAGGG